MFEPRSLCRPVFVLSMIALGSIPGPTALAQGNLSTPAIRPPTTGNAGGVAQPSVTAPPGMPPIAPGGAPAAGAPAAAERREAGPTPPTSRPRPTTSLPCIEARSWPRSSSRKPSKTVIWKRWPKPPRFGPAKDPNVSTKHQKLFQAILDKELPDSEMETLASQFEGYQVQNVIVGASTGRANVILAKSTQSDMYQKTVVVRKEKAGWKVIDFTGDRSFVGRKSRKAAK